MGRRLAVGVLTAAVVLFVPGCWSSMRIDPPAGVDMTRVETVQEPSSAYREVYKIKIYPVTQPTTGGGK